MIISNNFNRLLRGIIKEFRDQLVLGIEDKEEAIKITPAIVKTMLCAVNKNYPRDEDGKPLSFTKIDNKQACDLAEFIFKEGGERGFVFGVIEDEWNRLLKQAGIEK